MTLTKIASTGVEDSLRWVLGANGSSDYTFTGPGLTGTVNDPTIYLTRGHTYIFQNNSGGHPFYIKTSIANGGTNDAYNTGVTNNGGGDGTEIVFTVPHDSPDILYYQCSSHASMAGQFNIAGSVADSSITTAKLADGAVTGVKIASSAITNSKISPSGIASSDKLVDGIITTSKIADSQITTAKINDAAVTTAKIADSDVTTAKLQNGAVNHTKIADANVIESKIAANAVTTAKIADSNVTTAKIADSAVTDAKIASGISASKITGLSTDSITEGDSKVEVIDSGSNGNIQFITDNTTRAQFKTGSSCDNQLLIGTGGTSNQDIDVGVCIGSSSFSRPGVIIRGNSTNKGDISFCDNSQQDSADGVSEGLVRYDHATDHMEFHTADSERLRIDSSGRVGIGTGSSITNYDLGARTLILNESGSYAGMTVRSSNQGSIYFADGTTGNQSYRGRIEYDHVNDRMYMGTSSSTAGIHINSNNIVTKPSHPAFMAKLGQNAVINNGYRNYTNSDGLKVGGNQGNYLTTVDFNQGNHYNSSTTRFTAPVNGLYYFEVVLSTGSNGPSNSYLGVELYKNGTRYYSAWQVQAAGYQKVRQAFYLELSANDYVEPGYESAQTVSVIGDSATNKFFTYFTGYLIG